MNRLIYPLCLFAMILISCKQDGGNAQSQAKDSAAVANNVPNKPISYYGEPFDTTGVLEYDRFLSEMPAVKDSLKVKVRGRIKEVCQMRGCWFKLESPDPGKEEVMVRLYEHDFTVSTGVKGQNVIVNGIAFYNDATVEDLKDRERNLKSGADRINGVEKPLREITISATGIILD